MIVYICVSWSCDKTYFCSASTSVSTSHPLLFTRYLYVMWQKFNSTAVPTLLNSPLLLEDWRLHALPPLICPCTSILYKKIHNKFIVFPKALHASIGISSGPVALLVCILLSAATISLFTRPCKTWEWWSIAMMIPGVLVTRQTFKVLLPALLYPFLIR